MLWLYRSMIEDAGKPMLGSRGGMLGVRPGYDILISDDGMVRPETGGMSVTPRDPRYLPRHRKPPALGGRGRDPVFRILCAVLPPALRYAEESLSHGVIEPAADCPFSVYQENLHGTCDQWERMRYEPVL